MAMTGMDIKELTDNGLSEAAGLISRREYNLSIVRSRQTAEFVIKNYASEKNIPYTTLADTIEALYEQRVINRTSRDAFHNIRIYGNKAVHDGDNDPKDAQKAYSLLKSEIGTFLSRKTVSVDRTPIRIDKVSDRRKAHDIEVELDRRQPEQRRRSTGFADIDADDDRIHTDEENEALLRDIRRQMNGGRSERRRSASHDSERSRRSGSSSGRRSSGKSSSGRRNGSQGKSSKRNAKKSTGFTIYDLLRILIPVFVIILLIVIIRSFMAGQKPAETTEAPTTTIEETTTAAPVTEPETTEPETEPETTEAAVEYKTSTDGVNVRYADNQNRIYTQLPKDTNIGTVTPIDGSDFASFTLDGVEVVVNKSFIEPVQ